MISLHFLTEVNYLGRPIVAAQEETDRAYQTITNRKPRSGFSLLEIILATGILASSTVLLLSLFSTGERHSVQAENRVVAQMLCVSKLEELIADPTQIQSVSDEPFETHPEWTFTVDSSPSDVEGLIQLRVFVTKADEANPQRRDTSESRSPDLLKKRFEIVRLVRIPQQNKINGATNEPRI
ncbi:MAG: hypothetical protein FJ267_06960 [Planctomycetes bacterium]|nr:hypothetical protein [Planctomycetota bacterium]